MSIDSNRAVNQVSWIGTAVDREAAMAKAPLIGPHYIALQESFFRLPQVPAEVMELCRLRLAQLHGSGLDFRQERVPVDAGKRDNLAGWVKHPAFTEAERACLELTEVHAMDVGAITDTQADAVKSHYGDEGLVALVQALGTFDGFIRLGLMWGLPPGDAHGD